MKFFFKKKMEERGNEKWEMLLSIDNSSRLPLLRTLLHSFLLNPFTLSPETA